MKWAWATLVVAGLAWGQAATPTPAILSQAEALRIGFGLNRVEIALKALSDGLAIEADEALFDPYLTFRGSLGGANPPLQARLDEIMRKLAAELGEEDEDEGEDQAGEEEGVSDEVVEIAERGLALVQRLPNLLISARLQGDPVYQAALLSMLLVWEGGVSEAYEEAANGEDEAYGLGYIGLQHTRGMWNQLKPTFKQADAVKAAETGFDRLAQLMPTAQLPSKFPDPEDAEVAALDLAFALELGVGQPVIPRELGPVLQSVRTQQSHTCTALNRGDLALARERFVGWQLMYEQYLEGALQTLAPQIAEAIEEESDRFAVALFRRNQPAEACLALGIALQRARSSLE
jgi:hypothetical protein